MPTWSRAQFENKGAEIARAFVAAGPAADLTALAEKVAREQALNPEQIHTLAYTVNRLVFGAKFASMGGAADRLVDFDVCRPESIVERLHQQAQAPVKVAAEQYPDLPDAFAAARGHTHERPAPSHAKLAQELDRHLGGPENHARLAIRHEKIATDLAIEARRLEIERDRHLGEVKTAARYLRWDHDAFERDAVAHYGGDALPELNEVRAARGMAVLPVDEAARAKVASLQDRLDAGVRTPPIEALGRAIAARAKVAATRAAAALARERFAHHAREARGG